MKKQEKEYLTLDEMLQLASKIEFWEGRKPCKEEICYPEWNMDNLIYEGYYDGIHVTLEYNYNPNIYEGYETTSMVYASFQGVKLGGYAYVERSEEGLKNSWGSEKIKDLYFAIKNPRISKKKAIEQVRALLKLK